MGYRYELEGLAEAALRPIVAGLGVILASTHCCVCRHTQGCRYGRRALPQLPSAQSSLASEPFSPPPFVRYAPGYRYGWWALPKLPSAQSSLASESFSPPPIALLAYHTLFLPLCAGLPLCAEGLAEAALRAIVAGLGVILASTQCNCRWLYSILLPTFPATTTSSSASSRPTTN